MAKTQLVGARVEPWVKEIIKNRGLTVRDALELVAKTLATDDDVTWEEIRKVRNEIRILEFEHDRIMSRTDEIREQINIKDQRIMELEGQLQENSESIVIKKAKPSIESIFMIAERHGCSPLDVNTVTGVDTIAFHAMKVGVSKPVFVELLKSEVAILEDKAKE